MPLGLSRSCSLRVMFVSSWIAPRTTSLAGALWTPRVASLRAQIPGHVTRRWHEHVLPGGRVEHLEPRPVQGSLLRVVADLVDAPLLDLLGVESRRRIEDRHPVTHQLAVRDHRQLHRLHAFEVDQALLVGGHQVRHGEHRDLLHRLQAAEAGAVGRVADVVVGRQASRQRGRLSPTRQADGCPARWTALDRAADRRLLDLDQVRVGVDDRRHVLTPAAGDEVVEALELLIATLHDEPERLALFATLRRVVDLDRQPVAGAAGLLRGNHIASDLGVACRSAARHARRRVATHRSRRRCRWRRRARCTPNRRRC